MYDSQSAGPSSESANSIGRSFRNIGWLGFWTQIVLAVVPIIVLTVVFGATRGFSVFSGGIGLLGWFSVSSFVLLLFTTFWSWRYKSLGRRLDAGETPADGERLSRTVWVGVAASSFGILLSLVVVLAEVLYLLLVFLEAPQGGAPVFQTADGSSLSWITALDLLSLLALVLTAAAEIVTLLLSLWLIYRLSSLRPRAGSAKADAAPSDS